MATNNNDDITTKDLLSLADLYFYKKYHMFRHLHNSYDNFLEDSIRNLLENNDHIIHEKVDGNKLYRRLFKFSNIRISPPKNSDGSPLFPATARKLNKSYNAEIIATIRQVQIVIDIMTDAVIDERDTGNIEHDYVIAKIPLMLKSKFCSLNLYKDRDNENECDMDPGGYFIVGGSEKAIICQDRMVENKPLVFIRKDSGAISHIVQVNSKTYKNRLERKSQVFKIKINKTGIMNILVPILEEVNVFILFRALGIESDRDIINMITNDNDRDMIEKIKITLDECRNDKRDMIQTRDSALDYLINRIRIKNKILDQNMESENYIRQRKLSLLRLLENNFIPHMEDSSLKEKGLYLGFMINKLLNVVLDRKDPDDRDSYINKRVDLPGDLLYELFEKNFKRILVDCGKQIENRVVDNDKVINVISYIKPSVIEQGYKSALSTGTWDRKKGVAQVLQRLSYLQYIVMLRRIDSPSGDASTAKLINPRNLHMSSIPFLCCVSTPEHAKVGLTKHLSIISSMTIMSYDQYVLLKRYLKRNIKNLRDMDLSEIRNTTKVFLNGEWLGNTDNSIKLENSLEKKRLNGEIDNKNTSIIMDYDLNILYIYCDSGRLYRPVLKVNDNNELLLNKEHINKISLNRLEKNKVSDWDKLLIEYPNIIDYIDMEKQPFLLLAENIDVLKQMNEKQNKSLDEVDKDTTDNKYDEGFFIKYSHCEIHPSLLLGDIPINTPFGNSNPGARNVFNYAQSRQAIGIPMTNYRDRLDITYVLYHPQTPLVSTRASKYIGTDIMASGENCIVAIMCYTGFNQEDSIIFNKSAIDRGLFYATALKKYQSQIQKNKSSGDEDQFMKPDATKVVGIKYGSYEKLNDRGFVPEETQIVDGDIILGKVTQLQETNRIDGKQFRDSSEAYSSNANAVIDRVYTDIRGEDGYETRKVLIRSERRPNIGDKFATKNAQKGTIGAQYRSIDMPYTANGMRPDVLLNAHALPSRMTIGQLVECLSGKVGAIDGYNMDGTHFEKYDMEELEKRLEELGYESKGYEEMYNGMTGEKIDAKIFIGPTYYMRLKHMVEDKIHGRARGPKTQLTRQPTEGRSRNGGLRLGEMEQQALVAHGASSFINEKMLYNSDATVLHVCDLCGMLAQRVVLENTDTTPRDTDIYKCVSCNNTNRISKVMIPYAQKLLTQELISMGIVPRIEIENDEYNDELDNNNK